MAADGIPASDHGPWDEGPIPRPVVGANNRRRMIRRWLGKPLFHLLALGALLFAVAEWRRGAGSNRIVVTPAQVDALAAAFSQTWQRPPDEHELKGLIDDHVREEIAILEAVAAGLHREDAETRRRLRQKLEAQVADRADATPVTDAELQAWLDAHPETFRIEAEAAFRHVYLDAKRRGAAAERDARVLLAKLTVTGPDAPGRVGDPSPLPRDVERSTRSAIGRRFGAAFAAAVVALEPGRWEGPVRSDHGLHLVWVHERRPERAATLAEARPAVESEVAAARRRRRTDEMYERLLPRYDVVVAQR